MIRAAFAFLSVLTLSACGSAQAPRPHPSPATEQRVDDAARAQAQAAAAYVEAGRRANASAPASPAKDATEGSLQTAAASLPAPTPEQVAVAMAPVTASLAGDNARATELWGKAQENILALQAALERAKLDREAERRANAEALDALKASQAAALAAERDRARSSVLREQVRWLNIAGGVFALGLGLCIAFGGLALLQRGAWVLGLFALLAFGLAQIVGAWWFVWAVGGVCIAAAGVFAWHTWKHRSAQAGLDALKPVVKVLDDAYDAALPEAKALLDEKVFDPLSKLMDKAQKSTVHDLRKS